MWANEEIPKLTSLPGFELETSILRTSRTECFIEFNTFLITRATLGENGAGHMYLQKDIWTHASQHTLSAQANWAQTLNRSPLYTRRSIRGGNQSTETFLYWFIFSMSGRSSHGRTKFSAYNEKLPFNPFPNKPWVLCVCSASLLKTLWEKEKLLLFPQCFLPVRKTFCHFHPIRNCRLQNLSVWKSLKFVVWERGFSSHPQLRKREFAGRKSM